MTEALPLDERIVAVLSNDCTAAAAASVLRDTEAALQAANAEADSADVASLSPLATNAQASALRSRAADLRFDADRLDAKAAALRSRIDELKVLERSSSSRAERDAAIAERDALAADLARVYPGIVGSLTRLVKRIEESDARCAAAGVHESAEAKGRGLPPTMAVQLTQVMRLRDARLPMPAEHGLAWDDAGPWQGRRWNGLSLPEIDAQTEAQR